MPLFLFVGFRWNAVYMLNSVLFFVCWEVPGGSHYICNSGVYILLGMKWNSGESHKGFSCMNETLSLFYVMFDRKLLDTVQHRDWLQMSKAG